MVVLLLISACASAGNGGEQALVCEPCKNNWTLQQMAGASDVVILARRTDYANKYQDNDVVEQIMVKVTEVLKGEDAIDVGDRIYVKSWYDGTCPYGVQMDRGKQAVLMLNLVHNSFFSKPVYESVTTQNNLCNDDSMTLDGKDLLIWDPVVRKEVKFPYEQFKKIYLQTGE